MFVGNETEVDVVGGNAMGWTTVLIKGTEASSGGLAARDCNSFQELEQFIFGNVAPHTPPTNTP
jgi:ribonucleotide monophosphatase NagD (HAD superfamily)